MHGIRSGISGSARASEGAEGVVVRVLVMLVLVAVLSSFVVPADAQYYRSHAEIGQILLDAETDYPSICKRYDLGSSVQGRSIWALRISDNVTAEEDEPEFKYISTMHGNEIVGNEMCLYLIEHLTTNYGSDPSITNLVDEIEIWIVPLMNPDGYEASPRTRRNANNTDLNRDFPDPFTSPDNTPTGRAVETGVIMNWSFGRSFTLSANIHTGALVVNYPFDNNPEHVSVYTASPDDDLFIWISEEYSQYNLPMWNSSTFTHGITNGADWYWISGGMQDWSYRYMGCNEVTLELSNYQSPYPNASELPTYWNENRDSMLAYIETCLVGIRGIVTDGQTGLPLAATVEIVGRDHEIYTDPDVGDYHRMLLPGTYDLTFTADGYDPLFGEGVVVYSGDATRLDVEFWPGPGPQVSYPTGGEELSTGQEASVTWTGNPDLQFHVQYTANFGDLDTITDGFESGSLDPAYSTGGDADWLTTTADKHTGLRSARAGDIGDNQVSWMTREVGGGDVSFWYRASSEESFSGCYDSFNFYIDGDKKFEDCDDGTWTYYSTTLDPGSHELKWEYKKDVDTSWYDDTVYIDDLQVVADNTTWEDIVALTPVGATSTPWTPPAPGTDYKVRVRSFDGGSLYGQWDESETTFSVVGYLPDAIPTVSEWGLIMMTLLVMTVGTLVFRRHEQAKRFVTVRSTMSDKRSILPVLILVLGISPLCLAANQADIHGAAESGNVARVKGLLAESPDLVNARNGAGETPLLLALRGFHSDAARALLAGGADVGATDRHGQTALHLAVRAGGNTKQDNAKRRDLTASLLEAGASVKAADPQGNTALHVAAIKGRTETLPLLVASGASITAKDARGRTALHDAAMYNHADVIGWLLKKGADLKSADKEGDTPLHLAALRFKEKATRVLVSAGADVGARNARGATPLHVAASAGPEEVEVDRLLVKVATVLLESGADVNAVDLSGATPLHYALERGHGNLAELLRLRGGHE